MTEPARRGRIRRIVTTVLVILVIIALVVVLYPQLQDFGAEVYRAVTGT